MNELLKNYIWLESWESSKKYNVEIGFDNHTLLKGYMSVNEFTCLEQLPDIDFFLELKELIPRLYAAHEVIYGEAVCYIKDEKYRVIYHYDKNCYMITDANDTIIKKI